MGQRKAKTPHNGGTQLPLIVPDSNWKPLIELPDLRNCNRIALDRETKDDGLAANWGPGWAKGREGGHVCGTSVAWHEGSQLKSAYFPLRHTDTDNFPPEQVAQWEIDHQKAGVRFVFQNGPYDIGWGTLDGIPPPVLVDDTIAMANVIDEQRPSFELNALCAHYGILGKDERLLKEALVAYGWPVTPKEMKKNLWRLPARYIGPYAEQDAAATLHLADLMDPEIDAQNVREAYQLEMDLLPMVHEMRRRGIRIDLEAVEQLTKFFRGKREEALEDLSDHLGHTTGIDDLRRNEWLDQTFTRYHVSFPRERGRGSFEAKWMRRVDHWLPRLVCKAKAAEDAAEKFLQTYIVGFAHNGRLHASINQFRGEDGGTRTSRFSYADPPLQQIPMRNEEAALIRCAFLPEIGEWWLSADYCYDKETEILTERGWIKFPELGSEKIAQWHQKTGVIDFVEPISIYVGEQRQRRMVRIKSLRHDLLVTENHRILLRHCESGQEIVVPAAMLDEHILKSWWIPQQTNISDDVPDLNIHDDLLRLVVACQADAADRWKYKRREEANCTWVFYLTKEHKVHRLKKILRSLDIMFREKHPGPDHKETRVAIRLDDFPALRVWLGTDKTFNYDLLHQLSLRQKKIFIEELFFWDGSPHNDGLDANYGSENKKNSDTVNAIATQCGYAVRSKKAAWTKPGRKDYFTSNFRRVEFNRSVRGGVELSIVIEENQVYCVTMPSSFVVVRRNGKVAICGQSQQEYRLIVHFAERLGLRKADIAAQKYRDDPRTDFHNMVAEMTGLARKPAKDTNFAKSYGAGIDKFAAMIGQSREKAMEIMNQYDQEMPFVKELYDLCQRAAEGKGYVLLLDRARIHFNSWEPTWLSEEEKRRGWGSGGKIKMASCSYDEAMSRVEDKDHPWHHKRLKRSECRKAMNAKIQGSGARMTKMSMRACWRAGHVPLIQIHDELGFSVREEQQGQDITEIMREVIKLNVPMIVDAEYGKNWGDAKHVWAERGDLR